MQPTVATRALLFGVGRSGTTWAGTILGATRGARFVPEPDNASSGPFAVKALRGHGPTLVLGAGDAAPPAYEQLWAAVLGGGPARRLRGRNAIAQAVYRGVPVEERRAVWGPVGARGSRRLRIAIAVSQAPRARPEDRVVAKTVTGVLAIEWIVTRFRPRAAWIRRHPLDVVAGRLGVQMPAEARAMAAALETAGRMPAWCPPPPAEGSVAVQAWRTGLAMSWCRAVVAAHPEIVEVSHEALCRDPQPQFAALADRLGLEWDEAAAQTIRDLDRPGSGYSVQRVTADQSGKWRGRLDEDDQRAAIDWLRRFPIAADYDDLG